MSPSSLTILLSLVHMPMLLIFMLGIDSVVYLTQSRMICAKGVSERCMASRMLIVRKLSLIGMGEPREQLMVPFLALDPEL